MASSMGYVMMNWTSELVKQAKKKNRRKIKEEARKSKEEEERKIDEDRKKKISVAILADLPSSCVDCEVYRDRIALLETQLQEVKVKAEEVDLKLEAARVTLNGSKERENKLKDEKEKLILDEAQVRYELSELRKTLQEELTKRDNEHEEQVHIMEQLMSQKDYEWQVKVEALQQDLNNTLHSSYQSANLANMSRGQLEQEIASLRTVIDLRSQELQDARRQNQELGRRLERQHWLEKELDKAKHRLEEMNLVLQNKMVSEKELIDMTEGLTNDLSNARNEILTLRRELENRKYLLARQQSKQNGLTSQEQIPYENNIQKIKEMHQMQQMPYENMQQLPHRNQHQKASYGGKDPSLVLDVVEKSESVAWMLHIPDSPKISKC